MVGKSKVFSVSVIVSLIIAVICYSCRKPGIPDPAITDKEAHR
jgi:hypothetical protein